MSRLKRKGEVLEVYHGTSSDSVDSIMSTGIKAVVGGDGDGAYVSTDYEDAKVYAIARAGERRRYSDQFPEFSGVYPVMIVVKVDDSELRQGLNTNMFAPEGISPDNIVEVIDLSNEEPFPSLVRSMELEEQDGDQNEIDTLFQKYMSYAGKYID